MVRVHFGPPFMKAETGAGGERRKRVRGKGLESRLLATVRWTVATGVAFPQKSESILAHQLLEVISNSE